MKTQQLPERANLEQLKKQAKTLLRAVRAKDPAALGRFQAVPALASMISTGAGAADLALHDAQFVIAREHGFKSGSAKASWTISALSLRAVASVSQTKASGWLPSWQA